jgi:acetylornithine deacetylase/succinyl-diaminopimelate desuccinylase family protein
VESALSFLDHSYTVAVLKDLIRIPSVVGEEGALASFLYQQLEGLGLHCELHEIEPGRQNIYAVLPGSKPGSRLNFCGHLDTVPPGDGWTTDPFSPVEKDGRMYGLGACDMKAGIACVLSMIHALVRSGESLHGELSFAGVIDEEAHGKGARAMLNSQLGNVDAIVLAEPYPGDVTKPIPLGITGKILYDIRVIGKAAHGFRPHLGLNAIEDAAEIIANLDRLDLARHPEFGSGNTCTLKIEGGYQIYSVVIPDRCRFEVNRLLVPGEDPSTAIRDMEQLVASLGLRSDVLIELKPPQYDPFVMDRDEQILQIFDDVYRCVMGVDPLYEYASGITDANIFTGEGGIPCLHLGPRRGAAHQENEFVPLEWLPRISTMFTMIAARFLAPADTAG